MNEVQYTEWRIRIYLRLHSLLVLSNVLFIIRLHLCSRTLLRIANLENDFVLTYVTPMTYHVIKLI